MHRAPLVLITGPSGAGKDSLIAAARARLAGDGRFVFARRHITRPADPGGEGHIPVGTDAFAAMEAAGRFALCWDAYGHHYGIGGEIAGQLAEGRCVIANVSRGIVAEARRRFDPLLVVSLEAPAALLARRLAARRREDAAETAARLRRAALPPPTGADVVRLRNDGALDTCLDALLGVLLAHAPA